MTQVASTPNTKRTPRRKKNAAKKVAVVEPKVKMGRPPLAKKDVRKNTSITMHPDSWAVLDKKVDEIKKTSPKANRSSVLEELILKTYA